MEQQNQKPDDQTGVSVIGHLVIRDAETKRVFVNQRGTAKNIDLGDEDED